MYSTQGGIMSVSTSTPTTSSTSANSGPTSAHKPHPSQRPSSGGSTLSTTSIMTAKRTSSMSAGVPNPIASMRAQSPNDASLIALRVSHDSSGWDHRRRRSVAVDSSDNLGGDGLENLDRWSRSTGSSVASMANTRRSRASSGAVLPSLLHKSFSPQKPKTAVRRSSGNSPQRNPSLRQSAQRHLSSPPASPEHRPWNSSRPDPASLTALPPLSVPPALTDPNDIDSPATLKTITTPQNAQSPYVQEYYHAGGTSPQSIAKGKQPLVIRSSTGPISATNSSYVQSMESMQEPLQHDRFSGQRAGLPVESNTISTEQPWNDTSAAPQEDERGHKRTKTRSRVEKDKKTLLSKALQKANTAVLLDNAQNFESALEAYNDACTLLKQVMERSTGAEDRRKLDSIRVTYSNRIDELRQMEALNPVNADEKDLPARPLSNSSSLVTPNLNPKSPMLPTDLQPWPEDGADNAQVVEYTEGQAENLSASFANRGRLPAETIEDSISSVTQSGDQRQPVSISNDPPAMNEDPILASIGNDEASSPAHAQGLEESAIQVPPLKTLHLPAPKPNKYMPRPLSPRRPSTSDVTSNPTPPITGESNDTQLSIDRRDTVPFDEDDGELSTSWLDTIDETGHSSRSSSIHSRSSQHGLHRRPIPRTSLDTDPDFDAAFDAAVEAAYDEGFEPDLDVKREIEPAARRHAVQDSVAVRSSTIQEVWSPSDSFQLSSGPPLGPEDDEDEEERILDEITQDLAQTFNFDLTIKSALPRQSDSSGYSRDTRQSSMLSDRATAATSLSTVAEDTLPPQFSQKLAMASLPNSTLLEPSPSLVPPPQSALPKPPAIPLSSAAGVRSRRLSGQNPKQLKIETSTKTESRNRASTFHLGTSPFREDDEQKLAFERELGLDNGTGVPLELTLSESDHHNILKSPPSLSLLTPISDDSRPMTARTTTTTTTTDFQRGLDDAETDDIVSTRPSLFRKNKSSVSLREHTVLLSPTDHMPPISATPMSSTFMQYGLKRLEGPLTSQRANFPTSSSVISDGSHASSVPLFDTSLTSSTPLPTSPRSPPGAPFLIGLEPCPESSLLRPFWLMRTLLTTISHPKGGFITTRLFVPREVWQTRAVKLKAVEDKIANCDLLTAALGQLAVVDTYDADAIMVELQNFEDIMVRVESALVKKLGNDVGNHGLAGLFKDASVNMGVSSSAASANGGLPASDGGATAEKTKSKEGKGGYLTSWRKLRSKTSGAPLNAHGGHPAVGKVATEKEGITMPTVPMTSFIPVERRGNKKDARNLIFEGFNKDYMGSLARLFEKAQVLDLIARQVEDPGLRGTSPTHVGLELSIRHASEFFGFYICRFVLTDLGLLLDKYLKRGSEWVLA